MKNKSILEQALLQVQNLEEAVKTNAKGILSSTMKEELNELLKESMTEEDEVDVVETEDEMIPEENEDMSEQDDEENDEDDSLDMDSEDEIDSVDDIDSEDDVDDFGDETDDELDTDMDSDLDSDMDTENEFDSDFDMENDLDSDMDDDDTLDLTGASDEEVLKVFKSMKPEDGVIVKKDDDDISLEMDGEEYIIKDTETNDVDTGMDELAESDEDDIFFDLDDEKSEEEDIEVDIDEEVSEEEVSEEEEVGEAARTKWNPHGDKGPGQGRAGLKNKKMFKAGSGNNKALNEEVENLRKQNQEYKKALVLFKEKLNEVAVFNANLAYATRLFTENTTTKQEKLDILKRFDNVNTLNESKSLYKTIKTELVTKKPVTESVADKLNSAPKTSSSTEVLSESKAYENPQFKRMKELMGKVK